MTAELDDSSFVFPATIAKCDEILQEDIYEPLKICIGRTVITQEEGAKLCLALSNAKKVSHFFLIHTPLLPNVLENILVGLAKSICLRHVDLTGGQLGNTGAAIVAEFLKKNRMVMVLNMSQNKITNDGGESLAKALEANTSLSHMRLGGNLLTTQVADAFVSALSVNKTMLTLDLGQVRSAKLNSLLKKRALERELIYDNMLTRPNTKKTRFLCNKVTVIGEKGCGKSDLLQSLIVNKGLSDEVVDHRQGSHNTNGSKMKAEEYPTVKIRRAKTFDKVNFWQEVVQNVDHLTENALKTTMLLMKKKSKQARNQKMPHMDGTPRPVMVSEVGLEMFRNGGLRGNRTMMSDLEIAQSEDSTTVDDEFSIDRDEIPDASTAHRTLGRTRINHRSLPVKYETLRSMTSLNSFKTITSKAKNSLRKTHEVLSKKSSTFSLLNTSDEEGKTETRAEIRAALDAEIDKKGTMRSLTVVELDASSIMSESDIEDDDDDDESDYQCEEPRATPKGMKSFSGASGISSADYDEESLFRSAKLSSFEEATVLENIRKRNMTPKLGNFEDNTFFLRKYVAENMINGTSFDLQTFSGGHSAFEQMRKEYNLKLANKKLCSGEFESQEDVSRSDSVTFRSKKVDPDSNLRSFSHAFKEQETLTQIAAINDHKRRTNVKSSLHRSHSANYRESRGASEAPGNLLIRRTPSANKGRNSRLSQITTDANSSSGLGGFARSPKNHLAKRKTRLPKATTAKAKQKPSMRRDFCDTDLNSVKGNINGLHLNFWEFSDNLYCDALYTGFYNKLMTCNGYGLNVICFDLGRFLRQKQNAKKCLLYYLKLNKLRPETRCILVGVKLDKIKSQQDMTQINAEVKKCIKEVECKGLVYNKDSKLYFFPVDNRRLYGISNLRRKIEAASKSIEHVNRNIKLKHVALLDLLTCVKYDGNGSLIAAVKLEEVKFWAEKLDIEKYELRQLLQLFHESGYILHFPKSKKASDWIICNIDWFLESITHLFNANIINRSYNILYNGDELGFINEGWSESGDELEGDGSVVNSTASIDLLSRFMINKRLIKHIINETAEADVNILVTLLKEHYLLCSWPFDTKQFYQSCEKKKKKLNGRQKRTDEPEPETQEFYVLTPLLNSRKTIYEYDQDSKLAAKKSHTEKLSDSVSVPTDVRKHFDFQILFRAHENKLYPSSFSSTLVCALVQFSLSFKQRLGKAKSKSSRSAPAEMKIKMHQDETTGFVVVEFILGSFIRFYIRPELKGISVFIPRSNRKGIHAAFTIMKNIVQKVDREILKLGLHFDVKIGRRKQPGTGKVVKLISLTKLITKNRKHGQVFDELVGTSTFKVAGINQLENFLRQHN